MRAQHAGDFLHRVNLGKHGALAPTVEKYPGPMRGNVIPEELKVFLQQITAHGLQVVAEEIAQFYFLPRPRRLALQNWHPSIPAQMAAFPTSADTIPYPIASSAIL